MGLIDKLRRVGGIAKNRLASAVGALKGALGGVTVSGARIRRGVRFAARGARLTTPTGLALTAAAFLPEILRGARALPRVFARGVAFFGGRQVVAAAGAGGVAGALTRRRTGGVQRPSDVQTLDPRTAAERNRDIERAFKAERPRPRKRRAPTRRRAKRTPARRKRRKARDGRRKRRTHRSPRHKGHKRVSFTTASGKKVSFLVNPKARHR